MDIELPAALTVISSNFCLECLSCLLDIMSYCRWLNKIQKRKNCVDICLHVRE